MSTLIFSVVYRENVDQGRHFSFFQGGGGEILTNFLGGAKYEEKKSLCAKTQKNHYFSNSGGGIPPQMTSLTSTHDHNKYYCSNLHT